MEDKQKLIDWDEVAQFISNTQFSAATMSNIIRAQSEHNANFSDALSKGQLASKVWLVDTLSQVFSDTSDSIPLNVCVVGGWTGLLSAMLFNSKLYNFCIDSVDLNPQCAQVANLVNYSNYNKKQFTAITANMYEFDYTLYDIIINTCCEHILDLPGWLSLLPKSSHVVLQSNNFTDGKDHVNCSDSLANFKNEANISTLYSGSLELPNYTRYMLIGSVQ